MLELYHGPTLAFKDIAMQVIGNLYSEIEIVKNKVINIVVATSGDTGSAAISALNNKKISMFLYYIHIIKSQKSKKNNDYYWFR